MKFFHTDKAGPSTLTIRCCSSDTPEAILEAIVALVFQIPSPQAISENIDNVYLFCRYEVYCAGATWLYETSLVTVYFEFDWED